MTRTPPSERTPLPAALALMLLASGCGDGSDAERAPAEFAETLAPSGSMLDASLDVASAATTDAAIAAGPDASSLSRGSYDGGASAGDDGARSDARADGVVVANVIVGGPGCRSATTQITFADDRSTFDLDLTRYTLETSAEDTINSTGCTLSVQVDAPPGKSFTLERFVLRGTTDLPAGASARLSAYYSYVGLPRSGTKVIPLTGPRTGTFEAAVQFGQQEQLARACDGTQRLLNLLVSMSIDAAESEPVAHARLEQLRGLRFGVRDCP